jgi:hypothetical protein
LIDTHAIDMGSQGGHQDRRTDLPSKVDRAAEPNLPAAVQDHGKCQP